ncbi:hypothetical protein U1Q18_051079 [Sarracenia purpurea var. burkii]
MCNVDLDFVISSHLSLVVVVVVSWSQVDPDSDNLARRHSEKSERALLVSEEATPGAVAAPAPELTAVARKPDITTRRSAKTESDLAENRSKKNYQIVFIKAPTPAPPSAPVIPPFPPQSDKTLIYVLHPKPEEAPPIHIPAPPQNAPVKPEVYFIRYKSKKEQEEDDVNGIVDIDDDGGGGGGGYHHRRYGRDGLDEETDEESESLDVTDSASGARSSAAPLLSSTNVNVNDDGPAADNDNANDNSGESSNIIRIYTTERGGKNTH